MVSFRALVPALLALAAVVDCKIQWSPCNKTEFDTSVIPFECGTLDAPLDYTEPNSDGKLTLELIKVPALKSKGGETRSILFNLGGPGLPARHDLSELAPTLIPFTGGQYDLIAFDSRGTANTLPFKCSDDPYIRYSMFSEQVMSAQSDVAVGRLWARGTIDAQNCYAYANKTGGLISTAFVARDLISVVDALEEDGMLRYWGLSYGTTLGATVTAMFPDRVDKVILDAVQNPHEYYHAHANFEEWIDADKSFSRIFSTCIEAGPKLCPLAARNKTAEQLEKLTWDLVERVKYHPIVTGTTMWDYGQLKALFAQALYSTQLWPYVAIILDGLLFDRQGPIFPAPSMNSTTVAEPLANALSMAGIYCGDNQARASNFEEFAPTIPKLYQTSRVMGDIAVCSYSLCAQWKIKPKETYTGSFDVRTKNPVLFIGNTYDGHTPVQSTHNLSSTYDGSVVLEVNGYGHGSTAIPSKCTLETVAAYWLNGTLPELGKVCQADVVPYTQTWWPDIFKSAGVDPALIEEDASGA